MQWLAGERDMIRGRRWPVHGIRAPVLAAALVAAVTVVAACTEAAPHPGVAPATSSAGSVMDTTTERADRRIEIVAFDGESFHDDGYEEVSGAPPDEWEFTHTLGVVEAGLERYGLWFPETPTAAADGSAASASRPSSEQGGD